MKPLSFLLLPGLCAAVCAASPSPGSPLAMVPAVLVQEDAVAEVQDSPDISEEIDEIIAEHSKAYRAWVQQMRAADEAERETLMEDRPDPNDAAKKIMALIEPDATATGAVDGLAWIIQSTNEGDAFDSAVQLLEEHYIAHEKMADVARSFRRPSESQMNLLESILEKNESVDAQAWAAFNLANGISAQIASESLSDGEKGELEARAVKFYELAQVKGDGVDAGRDRTVADLATSSLFELQNLSIGKTAPDIVAEDVGGTEFKLSDYRGKVVMLDFWGDW